MNCRSIRSFGIAASLLLLGSGGGFAADGPRISGPVVHENLALYFLHGESATGAVPLTLEEALARGGVKVYETGNVNELSIENLGGEPVFVHSGDIVKGGQQDRTLTVSLMLPPKSGRIPIAAFCVEEGRWSARGGEDVRSFAMASAMMPSREAKVAMRAPPAPAAASPSPRPGMPALAMIGGGRSADTGSRQQQVWSAVAAAQAKLAGGVGAPVAAPQSRSSLQLSLENEKLKAAQEPYLKALTAAGEAGSDIVGYVFAINGAINSADVYPSNALFRKLWHKLLAANVTEAIGDRKQAGAEAPAVETVRAFLAAAEAGKPSERPLPVQNAATVRDTDRSLFLETRAAGGAWVHRSYVAK